MDREPNGGMGCILAQEPRVRVAMAETASVRTGCSVAHWRAGRRPTREWRNAGLPVPVVPEVAEPSIQARSTSVPFFDSDNRPALTPFGDQGPALRTFWGDNIMISLVDMQAGSVVPVHSHPEEQAGYVVSGTLEFTMQGETTTVGPGGVFFVPGNVEHSVVVKGTETARVVDIFSPIREDYKY